MMFNLVCNNVKSINGPQLILTKIHLSILFFFNWDCMHRFENKVYMTTSRRTITNILSTESSLFIVFFSSFFFSSMLVACIVSCISIYSVYSYLRFILKSVQTIFKYLIQGTNKIWNIHTCLVYEIIITVRTLYRILSNVYIFFIFFILLN